MRALIRRAVCLWAGHVFAEHGWQACRRCGVALVKGADGLWDAR